MLMKLGTKQDSSSKQYPECNGYYITSDIDDNLISVFYSSLIGPNSVGRFVDEINNLENRIVFYFENTAKEEVMSEVGENHSTDNSTCWICEKEIDAERGVKVRDHLHLTAKYRGPTHEDCILQVEENRSRLIPVMIHKFSNYDCHLLFITFTIRMKKLVRGIPKPGEIYSFVKHRCIRFLDSYRFLQSSVQNQFDTLQQTDIKVLEKAIPSIGVY